MRLAAVLAFVLVTSVTTTVKADSHHKIWWQYLVGAWTYEDDIAKGEVTFRMAPSGEALIGEWRDEGVDGASAFEISGWQSDKKIVVASGYGEKGEYWHVEFNEITADGMEGADRRVMRNGIASTGKTVTRKIDANSWTWTITGKTDEGKEIKSHGKVTRKK